MFTEKMISPPAVATVDDFSASILTRPQVSRSVPRLLPPRPRPILHLYTFCPGALARFHGRVGKHFWRKFGRNISSFPVPPWSSVCPPCI